MNQIVTRQAILDDLDAVVPLFDAYRQFYNQPSDPLAARVFLRGKFNHGESVIFLAWEGPTPVGFTQLFPSFSSVSMARIFLLNDLFVVPSHRRQGVGAGLLDAAVQYGRSLGAVRLSLTTNIANLNAQATYEARGWKRDEAFYVYHFLPAVP
jgi:GNAT superfamily N-acetyltransferase